MDAANAARAPQMARQQDQSSVFVDQKQVVYGDEYGTEPVAAAEKPKEKPKEKKVEKGKDSLKKGGNEKYKDNDVIDITKNA